MNMHSCTHAHAHNQIGSNLWCQFLHSELLVTELEPVNTSLYVSTQAQEEVANSTQQHKTR